MGEAQAQPERLKGNVKWFNSTKGFGFITVEGTEDEVFVHQSNIDTTGFRSLQEHEPVEFDLVISEDGKRKAFHVTGPEGAPPLGSTEASRAAAGLASGSNPGGGGGGNSGGGNPRQFEHGFPPGTPPYAQGFPPQQSPGGSGRGGGSMPPPHQGYFMPPPPDAAYMPGYYPMGAAPPYPGYQVFGPRGRGQFFPGGRNWAGARPPPPGQPGFSSGLQVVVHNLPWDCTWQQLRDAFQACGEIERADVVFDSRGRSRGFGIVRFPNREVAEAAVAQMNNSTIGGRVVSVRLDRFA